MYNCSIAAGVSKLCAEPNENTWHLIDVSSEHDFYLVSLSITMHDVLSLAVLVSNSNMWANIGSCTVLEWIIFELCIFGLKEKFTKCYACIIQHKYMERFHNQDLHSWKSQTFTSCIVTCYVLLRAVFGFLFVVFINYNNYCMKFWLYPVLGPSMIMQAHKKT